MVHLKKKEKPQVKAIIKKKWFILWLQKYVFQLLK